MNPVLEALAYVVGLVQAAMIVALVIAFLQFFAEVFVIITSELVGKAIRGSEYLPLERPRPGRDFLWPATWQ